MPWCDFKLHFTTALTAILRKRPREREMKRSRSAEDREDEGQGTSVSSQAAAGPRAKKAAAPKKRAGQSQGDFLEQYLLRKEARQQARESEAQADQDGVQHFLLGFF